MSLSPQLIRTGCKACRLSVLRIFTQSFQPESGGRHNTATRNVASVSTFCTTPSRRADTPSPAIRETIPRSPGTKPIEEDADDSETPWYLEVEPPRHPSVLYEPPPLPDIPDDSPRVMEPLLKYSSEDLGLDDLSILDLRAIQPPPALGPKLIMLFGTARSERHLHVSAGRLMRWLRARGHSAHADGLLGRNELKVKLRRKARKAKLLGNTDPNQDGDDGIRTGWVCVNLGTTGWSDVDVALVGEDGKMAGFGAPQTGTTIVVQLMTDRKRRELELETLWKRTLERSLARTAKIEGDNKSSEQSETESQRANDAFSSAFLPSRSQQRFFSSTAMQRIAPSGQNCAILQHLQSSNLDSKTIESISLDLRTNMDDKMLVLEQLKDYLGKLPQSLATEALSKGAFGSAKPAEPSAFLSLFSSALENMSPAQSWPYRMWLHTTARALGQPDYELASLIKLFDEMELDGIIVSRDQYLEILRAVIGSPSPDDSLLSAKCRLSMHLLDTMAQRGLPVLSQDVLVALIESIIKTGAQSQDARELQGRLETLLDEGGLSYMGDKLLMDLLDAYAKQGNWDRFWNVWRIPPRFERGRSAQLYTHLLRLIADTKSQIRCIEALRWTVQEMFHEQPPVKPEGELLEALKECARIADPEAEALAESLAANVGSRVAINDVRVARLANREFVKLFASLRQFS